MKQSAGGNSITLLAITGNPEKEMTPAIGLISLNPLMIAVHEDDDRERSIHCLLIKKNGIPAAKIMLQVSPLNIPGYSIYLITGSKNYQRNFIQTAFDLLALGLKNTFQQNKNFVMPARQIRHLFNFCIYPRPVYLLSCGSGDGKHTFPIDVVRIYKNKSVLFSIRKTSRAHETIRQTRLVLLCRAPYQAQQAIYSLGKSNYSNTSSAPVSYANYNGIDYPSFGFHGLHILVESFHSAGEHYCYAGRIITTIERREEEQLFHIPWFEL